jgi:hypothetical protein
VAWHINVDVAWHIITFLSRSAISSQIFTLAEWNFTEIHRSPIHHPLTISDVIWPNFNTSPNSLIPDLSSIDDQIFMLMNKNFTKFYRPLTIDHWWLEVSFDELKSSPNSIDYHPLTIRDLCWWISTLSNFGKLPWKIWIVDLPHFPKHRNESQSSMLTMSKFENIMIFEIFKNECGSLISRSNTIPVVNPMNFAPCYNGY